VNRSPSTGRLAATILLASIMALGSAAAAAQSPGPGVSGASGAPGPSGAVAGLSVNGAWVRVSPMVDLPDAGYMVIRNDGTADAALIGVTTPAARVVELHETGPTSSGGMMMMQPLGSIAVPARGTVTLEPGGYHLMLIDLASPLATGATVDLMLTFQDGTVLMTTAEVRSDAPSPGPVPMGTTMPMATLMPLGSAAP